MAIKVKTSHNQSALQISLLSWNLHRKICNKISRCKKNDNGTQVQNKGEEGYKFSMNDPVEYAPTGDSHTMMMINPGKKISTKKSN